MVYDDSDFDCGRSDGSGGSGGGGRLFEPFSGVTLLYCVFVFLNERWRWKDRIMSWPPL